MLRHASHYGFAPIPKLLLLASSVSLPLSFFQAALVPQFTDITPRTRISFRNDASRTEEKYLVESMTGGAAFLDYDRDGLIDLVVARYVEWSFSNNPYCGERKPGYRSYCQPDQFQPTTHPLFRNNGDGTFTAVSAKSALGKAPGKGLGVAVHDYNRDGWPDIAIANDSFPQQLFRNRGDGTFEEAALLQGAAYDDEGRVFAGMGIDFADMDNDGWPDLFVNALANQKYALFRNVKDTFEYTSGPSGLARATLLHSGWGAKLVDVDNDGWKDLFVAQGHVMDNIELTQPQVRYLEPPLLMRGRACRRKPCVFRTATWAGSLNVKRPKGDLEATQKATQSTERA